MKNPTTWTQLANKLGYSPATVRNWRKLPGSPKTKDVETWLAFVEEQALGVVGNRVGKDREHWLTRQAEFRAKLLEIDHERAAGRMVPKEDVDALMLRIALAQKRLLYDQLENQLPVKCDGLSAAQIRPIARDAADQICTLMQEALIEVCKQPAEAKEDTDHDGQ